MKIFDNDAKQPNALFPYEPVQSNIRLMAQQGLFLVPNNIREPFKNILREYGSGKDSCVRYLIPASMRIEGLKKLRHMNVTASVLFPGIDGFCKSLHSQVYDPAWQVERIK